MAFTIDVLDAGEAALATADAEISARTEDELMQPVRGVRIILAHAVIDEHRHAERIAEPDGGIDHRIVPRAQRLLEPAQDVSSVRGELPVVHDADARRLAPVGQAGWQHGGHHPMLPGMPLNGPARSDVIHPP